MKKSTLPAVVLTLLLSAPSPQAAIFCSEPVEPFCVESDTTFEDQLGIKRCRGEVDEYVGGLEGYVECLAAQQKEIRGRGDAIKERFECRASGKAGCPQRQRSNP